MSVTDDAAGVGAPDPQFDAELKEALGRATSKGYEELIAQIEVLQDVVLDEGMRIQKAMQGVVRMLKLKPEQIVESIRERISVLEQEKSMFETGISAEVDEQVAESNGNLSSLDESIRGLEAEQRRLENELQRVKSERERKAAERGEVQGQIQAINVKANAVRAKFQSAYVANLNTLKALLGKVQPSGN